MSNEQHKPISINLLARSLEIGRETVAEAHIDVINNHLMTNARNMVQGVNYKPERGIDPAVAEIILREFCAAGYAVSVSTDDDKVTGFDISWRMPE